MAVKAILTGLGMAALVAAGHPAYAASVPTASAATTTQQLETLHPAMQQALAFGDGGHWVMTLQADLNLLGFSAGPVDGVFGPKTENGVAAFQRANRLPATGTTNALTWQDILAGFQMVPPAAALAGGTAVPSPVKTLDGHPVLAAYQVLATAYGPSLKDNYPYGPTDVFGQPLHAGMIAVDPALIPLKSTVYVTGYQDPYLPAGGFWGQAMDTGGAIVGHRIDIFMNQAPQIVSNFGVQPTTVYVLGQ
ncbi:MAG: peptidoglycan-binding protein [Thermaerobacter sp.]|nr:peptidoglycan-binding protein [Thermaerobacter sp.]